MTAGRTFCFRPAVILSSSKDEINVAPVVARLEASGLQTIVIRFDDVLALRQQLGIRIDGNTTRVSVDGVEFDPDHVACAWWRKPNWVHVERADASTRHSVEREISSASVAVGTLIPPTRWLNSPDALRVAEVKPRQLLIADQLGFSVAPTLMTNDWDQVAALAREGEIVFKSLHGQVQTTGGNKIVFTTPLDASGVSTLARQALAWPGLFQQRLSGIREWRVTVIEQQVFAVAIELAPGLVDWRKHQLGAGVRFVRSELPPQWAEASRRLARGLGLGYAAIDLVETVDGSMYFLECNANGQYGWLEQDLGLPISAAIATALVKISDVSGGPASLAVAYPGGQPRIRPPTACMPTGAMRSRH